jgi:hypothetical protein
LETEKRIPWWLYLNVVSLDAPLIAVVWMFVFKKVWSVSYVEPALPFALGFVVWLIYVMDRLCDRSLHHEKSLSLRHEFHERHKLWFMSVWGIVLIATLFIGTRLQMSILFAALFPMMTSAAFFLMAIFSRRNGSVSYVKNLAAGFTFAWGVGAGLVGLMPGVGNTLFFSVEILCFGVLCLVNMTAIDLWSSHSIDQEKVVEVDDIALTLPLLLLAGCSLFFMQYAYDPAKRSFFVSVLVASALIYVINRTRHYFSVDVLRVIVDAVLLIAAGIFWLSL